MHCIGGRLSSSDECRRADGEQVTEPGLVAGVQGYRDLAIGLIRQTGCSRCMMMEGVMRHGGMAPLGGNKHAT
jgi:hypothetical protein